MKRILAIVAMALAFAADVGHAETDPAETLRPRMEWAMHFAMSRSPQGSLDLNSPWYGFSALGQGFTAERVSDTTVRLTVVRHPAAVVELRNVHISDTGTFGWGPGNVVASNPIYDRLTNIKLEAGQYKSLRGTQLTKTTSFEDATRWGFEAALEAQLGYTPGTATGGVTGHVKTSVKTSGEFAKKWGSSEVNQDTINDEITLPSPFQGYVEVKRDTSRIERSITAPPIFEHQIVVLENGTQIYQWDSWAELIRVLKGVAPTNRALAKEFYGKGLADIELKHVDRALPPIEWTATYDSVEHTTVNVISTAPAPAAPPVAMTVLVNSDPVHVPGEDEAALDAKIKAALEQHRAERRDRKRARREERRNRKAGAVNAVQ